jgi:hypothetical protein
MTKLKYCVYCGSKLKNRRHDEDEEYIELKCSSSKCGKTFEWNSG